MVRGLLRMQAPLTPLIVAVALETQMHDEILAGSHTQLHALVWTRLIRNSRS